MIGPICPNLADGLQLVPKRYDLPGTQELDDERETILSFIRENMKRLLVSLLLITAFCALPADARRVAGIEIPETLEREGVLLILNGAGIRTRYFLDVYVGGLYLKKRSTDAAAIMDADEPMAIKLRIVTGLITNDRMQKSIEEGFQKSTRGNTGPIREKIDALIDIYDEEINDEDIFEFVYVPGQGLIVYKNGVYRATIECGLPFKRALFGIWISDRPVQTSLKHGMLGLYGLPPEIGPAWFFGSCFGSTEERVRRNNPAQSSLRKLTAVPVRDSISRR